MDDQDDIVREFLVESYENLDQLDRDLVALEKEPHDRNRLASVFRTIHTIKGTCSFLSFPETRSRRPRRRKPAQPPARRPAACSTPRSPADCSPWWT